MHLAATEVAQFQCAPNISCERRVMVSSLEAPPTLFGAGEHCVFIDVGASCNTKLCVFK